MEPASPSEGRDGFARRRPRELNPPKSLLPEGTGTPKVPLQWGLAKR